MAVSSAFNYAAASLLIFLLGSACKSLPNQAISDAKIVNGSLVVPSDQIALHTVRVNTCSGSILSDYWVLTAGHCVALEDGTLKEEVSIGFWNGKAIKASKIILHPEYNVSRYSPNDIALVKIEHKIPNGYKKVVIANEEEFYPGSKVIIAGYGKEGHATRDIMVKIKDRFLELADENENGKYDSIKNDLYKFSNKEQTSFARFSDLSSQFSYEKGESQEVSLIEVESAGMNYLNILKELFMFVQSNLGYVSKDAEIIYLIEEYNDAMMNSFSRPKLNKAMTNVEKLIGNLIIYSSEDEVSSACYGDSGGPMFVETSSGLKQVGVTHGANLEKPKSMIGCYGTGVYMNLTKYKKFISDIISE